MRRAALVLAIGVGLVAGAARAELYKCQGPDGKTLFTSDRSQCPGADAHQPSGRVQRSHTSSAPAAAAPRSALRPAPDGVDEEAEAAAWRGKRESAQAALKQTEAQLETLREVVGWCNRGHEVFASDEDGLRHTVDCASVEESERTLRREQKRLQSYLAEGLEEECRRAGCLPGWLR
jgi:hypothetical protein